MIKLYILFPGLALAIVEIIAGVILEKKKTEIGAPLLFHGGTLIFLSIILAFITKVLFKDMWLFIAFILVFYTGTLIWLCNTRINQKKSKIYHREEERQSNWK